MTKSYEECRRGSLAAFFYLFGLQQPCHANAGMWASMASMAAFFA